MSNIYLFIAKKANSELELAYIKYIYILTFTSVLLFSFVCFFVWSKKEKLLRLK